MDLYEAIADHYELLFPLSPERLRFCLQHLPRGGGRMVDAGCATGELCHAVAARGHECIGVDLDRRMIERGRQSARQEDAAAGPSGRRDGGCLPGSLELRVASILDLPEVCGNRLVDLVVCLGNTLPHLANSLEVDRFVAGTRSLLRSGGRLVIQVLNYDRMVERGIRDLPTIEAGAYRFERRYEYESQSISFHGTLTDLQTGESFRGSTILRPVFREELLANLSAHFDSAETYGGYELSPPDPDAFALLYLAE